MSQSDETGERVVVGTELSVADFALVPWMSDAIRGNALLSKEIGILLGETGSSGAVVETNQVSGEDATGREQAPCMHVRKGVARSVYGWS